MGVIRRRVLPFVETSSLLLGAGILVWWGTFHITTARATQDDLERFATLRTFAAGAPDQSLWSPKRIRAWTEAVSQPVPPPLAVLRIPTIGLEVPVLAGTANSTLDRGVGHIDDT